MPKNIIENPNANFKPFQKFPKRPKNSKNKKMRKGIKHKKQKYQMDWKDKGHKNDMSLVESPNLCGERFPMRTE